MILNFELCGMDRLSDKSVEASHMHELVQRFDAEEYGIGCPSTSVYGVLGAKVATRMNILEALKTAFKNFGLYWERWSVRLEPQPYSESSFKYESWKITLTPMEE